MLVICKYFIGNVAIKGNNFKINLKLSIAYVIFIRNFNTNCTYTYKSCSSHSATRRNTFIDRHTYILQL